MLCRPPFAAPPGGRLPLAAGLALLAARAPQARADDCASHPASSEVTAHLEASEKAHHDHNADTFASEWKIGRQDALCTSELLDSNTVFLFSLLEGIDASVSGDPAHAIASYEAAQGVNKDFDFTDDWIFPEHFIRKQYNAARAHPLTLASGPPIWVPPRGTLSLNGFAAATRPPDLPVLWQYTSPGGIVSTGYVAEDEAPPWDAPWGEGAHQRQTWKRHLVVGAAATGAAAALSGAASLYFRSRVVELQDQIANNGPPSLADKVQQTGTEMQATALTGAGLAGAALTLGTAAVVVELRW